MKVIVDVATISRGVNPRGSHTDWKSRIVSASSNLLAKPQRSFYIYLGHFLAHQHEYTTSFRQIVDYLFQLWPRRYEERLFKLAPARQPNKFKKLPYQVLPSFFLFSAFYTSTNRPNNLLNPAVLKKFSTSCCSFVAIERKYYFFFHYFDN